MDKKGEKELFEVMDHVDAECLLDTIDEETIEISEVIPVDKEIMKSIKEKTYGKIGIVPKAKRKTQLWKTAAVIILSIAIGGSVLNHDVVLAGIKRALLYIPGLNYVIEKEEETLARYVLTAPIRKKTEDGFIEIEGVSIDKQQAMVKIKAIERKKGVVDKKLDNDKPLGCKSVSFRDKNGREYPAESYSIWGGSDSWEGYYTYEGEIKDIDELEILLKEDYNLTFPIKLEAAKSYKSYEDIGPTDEVHDIAITGIPVIVDNQLKINLLNYLKGNMRIDSYRILYNKEEISLEDEDGKKYNYIMSESNPGAGDFYYDIKALRNKNLIFTIPAIDVAYNEKSKVNIKIPKEGRMALNKTIELAGFPVDFTEIERIDKDTIRVYLDLHYDSKADKNITGFGLDGSRLPEQGWSGYLGEDRLSLKHLEFDIKPQMENMVLYIENAHVTFNGPWKLKLNLEEMEAH